MTSSSYAPPPDAGLLQTSDDEPIRPSPRRGCCAWRRAAVRRRHAAGQVAARGYRPWLLAGLLYMGSGLGLTLWRMLRRGEYRARLAHGEWPWLAGAVLFGGVLGPVLLMWGLVGMPASGAALLLNAEGVFTAVIAWVVFRENVDRRIFIGMLAIVAGAVVLSWPGQARFGAALPAMAVLGACLAWGMDNNLTRKVSLSRTLTL